MCGKFTAMFSWNLWDLLARMCFRGSAYGTRQIVYATFLLCSLTT
jgi:hypothetical protein